MRTAVFLLMLVFISCTKKQEPPADILTPAQMEPLLWDYIRADVFTTDFVRQDSTKNAALENLKMQTAIFTKYKTNKDQFYKSLDYYLEHSDLLSPIIDSMIAAHQGFQQRNYQINKQKPDRKIGPNLPNGIKIHEQSLQ
jgi:hypothetical protein